MSIVKFERVVSVSSEDPAFPADNLLKSNYSDKKWKCKLPGEKQISVVLQMESAAVINTIDIGNFGSAFIEVFVGKSSNPDDFKVLVVASSLMTLQEAKLGENMSNVRFFKEDSFVKQVSLEKWDRLKLVCSQPYNKFIQYGLSFVVVHSKSTLISDNLSPTLGKFFLKTKDEAGDISAGSLFYKRKDLQVAELKGAAAIRAASTSGLIDTKKPPKLVELNSTLDTQVEDNSVRKNTEIKNSSTVLRKDSTKKPKREKPKGKLDSACNGSPVQSSSSTLLNGQAPKRIVNDNKEKTKKKIIPNKRPEKPFNKLMEGVVFAISGFQNPYRSDLRSKAIAMGAKYKPDWDNTCTHLLCAFPNTPKFNQVLGQGKIITKEWIETCFSRRMRLPWRRYALHRPDNNLPESEEEVFEYIPSPPSPVDNRRRLSPGRVSSGEDTEDEIERVLMLQSNKQKEDSQEINTRKENNQDSSDETSALTDLNMKQEDSIDSKVSCSPSKTNKKMFQKNKLSTSPEKKTKLITSKEFKIAKEDVDNRSIEDKEEMLSDIDNEPGPSRKFCDVDVYEMDTEVEPESADSNVYNLPSLNEFYEGIVFFIGQDLSFEESKKVKRYIIAHKGLIVEKANSEVEFIISRSAVDVNKVKRICPTAIGVKPDWVWICHDQNFLPPPSKFEIN